MLLNGPMTPTQSLIGPPLNKHVPWSRANRPLTRAPNFRHVPTNARVLSDSVPQKHKLFSLQALIFEIGVPLLNIYIGREPMEQI